MRCVMQGIRKVLIVNQNKKRTAGTFLSFVLFAFVRLSAFIVQTGVFDSERTANCLLLARF